MAIHHFRWLHIQIHIIEWEVDGVDESEKSDTARFNALQRIWYPKQNFIPFMHIKWNNLSNSSCTLYVRCPWIYIRDIFLISWISGLLKVNLHCNKWNLDILVCFSIQTDQFIDIGGKLKKNLIIKSSYFLGFRFHTLMKYIKISYDESNWISFQPSVHNKSFALKIITPIPWLHQLSGGLAWAATRTL